MTYQRTHSAMTSASKTRPRYIASRAIGFVIGAPLQFGYPTDTCRGCTRTLSMGSVRKTPARGRGECLTLPSAEWQLALGSRLRTTYQTAHWFKIVLVESL